MTNHQLDHPVSFTIIIFLIFRFVMQLHFPTIIKPVHQHTPQSPDNTKIINPPPITKIESPDSSASAIKLFDDDINFSPPPTKPDIIILHSKLIAITDRLFFIQFRPANTMQQNWFLIQINLSQDDADDDLFVGAYSFIIFQYYPKDNGRPRQQCKMVV